MCFGGVLLQHEFLNVTSTRSLVLRGEFLLDDPETGLERFGFCWYLFSTVHTVFIDNRKFSNF